MKKVVCIIGRTAAGKDTVTAKLVARAGWQKVVSYTDAPMRSDQRNGREHWFVSREEMDNILSEKDVLAETTINGNRYCTTADQLGDGITLYIIDPKGFFDLTKRDDLVLIPCVITAPRRLRKLRAKNRGNFDFESRDKAEQKEFDCFIADLDAMKKRKNVLPLGVFSNAETADECAEDVERFICTELSDC